MPLASSRDLSRRACAQIGFNWGAAGVSTSVWKGVLVRDILLKCGVKNPAQGANHVCFLGAEVMPKGRYALGAGVGVGVEVGVRVELGVPPPTPHP